MRCPWCNVVSIRVCFWEVKDSSLWKSIHTLVFDFDGVFTDNKVSVDEHGNESVTCDRADGLAINILQAFRERMDWNLEVFILSKEKNPVVEKRAQKLGIDCRKGEDSKGKFLSKYLLARFGDIANIKDGLAFVGNDINDIPAMKLAGHVFVPIDAHPRTMKYATYISKQKGGAAFVRDVVETILATNSMTDEEIGELLEHR